MKKYRWLQGSKQHVKVILILRLEQASAGLHVYADVIKPRVVPIHGNNFRVEENCIIEREEVYPKKSKRSFTISLAEVLPKGWAQAPTAANDKVTIRLSSFHGIARQVALDFEQRRPGPSGSSPVDPRQEHVPSPGNSAQKQPSSESLGSTQMGDDKTNDPNWEYVTDSESDEPHMV
ncbi:MAG: hypothetical protein Q9220_007575 [cf. Caloplaca sp. 1 TL-2023]